MPDGLGNAAKFVHSTLAPVQLEAEPVQAARSASPQLALSLILALASPAAGSPRSRVFSACLDFLPPSSQEARDRNSNGRDCDGFCEVLSLWC